MKGFGVPGNDFLQLRTMRIISRAWIVMCAPGYIQATAVDGTRQRTCSLLRA